MSSFTKKGSPKSRDTVPVKGEYETHSFNCFKKRKLIHFLNNLFK